MGLDVRPTNSTLSMASSDSLFKTIGRCKANLIETYKKFNSSLMDHLYSDVILRQDSQGLNKKVEILYEDNRPPLKLCGLARISPLLLFENLEERKHL